MDGPSLKQSKEDKKQPRQERRERWRQFQEEVWRSRPATHPSLVDIDTLHKEPIITRSRAKGRTMKEDTASWRPSERADTSGGDRLMDDGKPREETHTHCQRQADTKSIQTEDQHRPRRHSNDFVPLDFTLSHPTRQSHNSVMREMPQTLRRVRPKSDVPNNDATATCRIEKANKRRRRRRKCNNGEARLTTKRVVDVPVTDQSSLCDILEKVHIEQTKMSRRSRGRSSRRAAHRTRKRLSDDAPRPASHSEKTEKFTPYKKATFTTGPDIFIDETVKPLAKETVSAGEHMEYD